MNNSSFIIHHSSFCTMGIRIGNFKDASIRLRREDPWTAQLLAEELWAILQSDLPVEIDGPLTIINDTDEPAIKVYQTGDSDVAMNISQGDIDVPLGTVGNAPEVQFGEASAESSVTGGSGIKKAFVDSISNDSLTCKATNSAFDADTFTVLKPPTLRSTATPPSGITYTPTGVQSRQASDGTNTENHTTVPAYAEGDEIYYAEVGDDKIDINVDARVWAKVFEDIWS